MLSSEHTFLLVKHCTADTSIVLSTALLGLVGIMFYYLVYQIFFHPLAGYPGPFLAKFSRAWLFYADVVVGRPADMTMEWHKKYGPAIRISSNELSINDMDVYDKIYSQTSQFIKAPFFYDAFANKAGNLFTYTSHTEYNYYKKLLSHVFARTQISKLEGTIYEKVNKLYDRIARTSAKSEPISLYMAFRCLTLEVMSEFAFGEREPAIDGEGGTFEGRPKVLDVFDAAAKITPLLMHISVLRSLMRVVTDWIPNDPFRKLGLRAESGLAALDAQGNYDVDHPIVFESMLAQAKKAGVDLEKETLISQGIMVLAAGTDTTATTLSYGLHCILSCPELYNHLQKEIASIMPNIDSQPTLVQLESCAYLHACVREMLRITTAVRSRLPRMVPEGGFELYGKIIPEGVAVSASSMFYHFNEKIFPSPWDFKPERWLGSDKQTRALERYLVPFSKGRRMCIGSNLAQLELYISVARFARRFDLVKLLEKDIKLKETFTAYTTQGIMVMLKERR